MVGHEFSKTVRESDRRGIGYNGYNGMAIDSSDMERWNFFVSTSGIVNQKGLDVKGNRQAIYMIGGMKMTAL